MKARRVLFIQFTNPSAYPPLQHAGTLLQRAGWMVEFIGTEAESSSAIKFPEALEQVTRRQAWVRSGVRQKLAYLFFALRCLLRALWWRPAWVYASDPLSTPVAVVLGMLGFRVLYHEHDAPAEQSRPSGWWGVVLSARLRIAASADLVVVPNGERLQRLRLSANVSDVAGWHCVWNVPMPDELVARAERDAGPLLRLHYHGSINGERLPMTLLEAVRSRKWAVSLDVYGYEVEPGFLQRLTAAFVEAGTRFHPACARSTVLAHTREGDVGIALFDPESFDPNHSGMAGASNKVFDYLASGLVVLLNDAPQWRALFSGHEHLAHFVPDAQATTLMAAFADLAADRQRLARARVDGPALIRDCWNYEVQFSPVLAAMSR